MENHRITLDAVVKLIKFILQTFDDGLAILTGTTEPPTTKDIARRLYCKGTSALSTVERYGIRIEGGERVPYAQILLENEYESTVTALGGWEFLNKAIRKFRSEYPESWLLFEQWSLFVKRGDRTQRRRLDKTIKTIGLYILTREDTPKIN